MRDDDDDEGGPAFLDSADYAEHLREGDDRVQRPRERAALPAEGADSGADGRDVERPPIEEEGRPSLAGAPSSIIVSSFAAPPEREPSNGLITFVDDSLFGAPLVPAFYPVRGLPMTPGPVTLIIGAPYGGKTLIAQDLLICPVLGLNAWGQFPCERGRVVHIDFEQGPRECVDRYERFARGRGIDPRELRGRLKLAVSPRIGLFDKAAEEAYKRAFDGAILGLIDSLSAASPGQDENDSRIGQGLYMLGRVSEATGCAILVVHHTAKPRQDQAGRLDLRNAARGSGAIFAAAGYAYVIEGEPGEAKRVRLAKGRSLADPPLQPFSLELAPVDVRALFAYHNPANPDDPGGFRVTYRPGDQGPGDQGAGEPARPARAGKRQGKTLDALTNEVLAYVRRACEGGERGVAGKAVISEEVHARPGRVSSVVDKLLESGALVDRPVKINGKGQAKPRYWPPELAPQDPEAPAPAAPAAPEPAPEPSNQLEEPARLQ